MIGRTIGRYRIVDKLGQGGMGSVWKAEDPVLGRPVALKFLPVELAATPEARQRFLREARAASALDHPGVATVYDVVEADGAVYLAMACIEGHTVSELAAGHPLAPAEAVRIALAAAQALGHAHGRGVLHRDVTGRNIMVARDGRVVVLDFGLALPPEATRFTTSNTLLGTVAYLAPEVAIGRPADARSDLYGLGVVLYEALTGTLPFRGERPEAILYSAVHEPPEPPGARAPGLPAALDQLVLRLLSKDPAARPRDAAELADALSTLALDAPAVRDGLPPAAPAEQTIRAPGAPQHGHSARRCLAVLPFNDFAADADPANREQDPSHVFARGLAETVSARLARLPELQVIPPSGAGVTPAPDLDARRTARTLGAHLLLSGTVRRVGGRVRVSYSLIDSQGVQVDGDTVDGSARDLFAVEDQLAGSVLRALRLSLAPAPRTPRSTPAARHPGAHEIYLQALGYLQRPDNEASVDTAIARLEGLVASGDSDGGTDAALARACLHKFEITRDPSWAARASSTCDRALAEDPQSPEVLTTLGNLHRATGRPAEAVEDFRRVIGLRPQDAEAHLGLARAYSDTGDLARAEEAYHRAIALRPGYWQAHNSLGAFHLRHGRPERAVEAWKRVIELTPDNARGHLNLGSAYFRMGRYDMAIEAYHRSLELRPDANACTSLGTVYFFLGEYGEAATMFEKGVALRPGDPMMWGNLADARRWSPGVQDRAPAAYEQAIALTRKLLEVNPRDAGKLGWLGEWLAKCGRFAEAADAVGQALALAPEDVDCMANAVRVHELSGRRGEALHWLAEAVRHGYGAAEFERDPELVSLRKDPGYRTVAGSPAPGGGPG